MLTRGGRSRGLGEAGRRFQPLCERKLVLSVALGRWPARPSGSVCGQHAVCARRQRHKGCLSTAGCASESDHEKGI